MKTSFTTVMLGILAATSALVMPRDSADGKYHGVSLMFVTSEGDEPRSASPSPIEIDVLTDTHNFEAYSIEIVKPYFNVDIDKVQCQAFRDEEGTIPGSAIFTYGNPAYLSTNLVTVGSVLCTVVEDSEDDE